MVMARRTLVDFHREAFELGGHLPHHRIDVLLIIHLDQNRRLVPSIDFAGDDAHVRDFHQLRPMPLADRLGIPQILRRLLLLRRLRPRDAHDARQQRHHDQSRRNFSNLHY